jgi:hypothetical protein
MKKLIEWSFVIMCALCAAIVWWPDGRLPKQPNQVNIPLYSIEQMQQELVDRGQDITVDGKFGPKTTQALYNAIGANYE